MADQRLAGLRETVPGSRRLQKPMTLLPFGQLPGQQPAFLRVLVILCCCLHRPPERLMVLGQVESMSMVEAARCLPIGSVERSGKRHPAHSLALLVGSLASGRVRHRDCPHGPTGPGLAEFAFVRLVRTGQWLLGLGQTYFAGATLRKSPRRGVWAHRDVQDGRTAFGAFGSSSRRPRHKGLPHCALIRRGRLRRVAAA